jgi:polyphosphate kinase
MDEAFTYALKDNVRAWVQQADGSYALVRRRGASFSLHQHLMDRLGA